MAPITVDGSILKMKAFPFSFLEKAKDWLYELAPRTVTSWESMKRAFLEKFFPTSRVILLRKKISGIQQNQGKSFLAYYKRFKTLVASCPQHQMKEELLIQYFYEGLFPIERQMLDASTGGALVDKTPVAAKVLIANRALNAQQYEGVGQRDTPRQQVNEASAISEIQSELANLTMLVSQVVEGSKMQGTAICGVCSMQGLLNDQCPQLIENGGWESAHAVGYQSPNQPRMIHSLIPTIPVGEIIQISNGGSPNNPNNKAHLGSNLRDSTKGRMHPHHPKHNLHNPNQRMQNRDKKVDELEKQVGQIAEFMGQFREQGKLPSLTIVNPKGGFETVKAITLRSGKEVETIPKPTKSSQKEDKKLLLEEEKLDKATVRVEQTLPQAPSAPKPSQTTKISMCLTWRIQPTPHHHHSYLEDLS
ncbi:uncharacterized protein [Pyrus communis]|uniref:uncharacterized protein n=1 Tax=Pyrus communis TaxID=23211 RepID=UPI0035C0FF8B